MIHLQGALGLAPLTSALQEAIKNGQVPIGRGRQLDQLIAVLVGEPVEGADPGALELVAHHSTLAIELHRQAPGGAPLALAQAEGTLRKGGREHRHAAAGQIQAAGPAQGLLVQGTAGGHQAAGIGHMDPDAPARLAVGLERQGIVDFAGVGVVDRDGFEAGEIKALPVARPCVLRMGSQVRSQGQELGAKPGRPGGAIQAGQAMGIPEAQVTEQATNVATAGPAARRLQGLAQLRTGRPRFFSQGQGLQGPQLRPLVGLGSGQLIRAQGLAGGQQPVPELAPTLA